MLRLSILLLICGSASAQSTGQPALADPEQRLWREIEVLAGDGPASQPYAERLATVPGRHAALIERVRSYQTLYPGGSRRDEAVRLELSALFELGSLRSGDFSALRERVAVLLAGAADDPARAEAAYWQILCMRGQAAYAATRPTSRPVLVADAELLDAYRGYMDAYPRSRHVLKMAAVLAEDALARGDAAGLRGAVERLSATFPNERVTAELASVLRRQDALGRMFWLAGTGAKGELIDTRSFAGRPVVVLVWASFEPAAVNVAAAVERMRVATPEVAVVGVSIDERADDLAAAAQALGLDWPQVFDGMGWAGAHVREWGVQRIPFVFVLDRDGRLLSAGSDDGWKEVLGRAIRGR